MICSFNRVDEFNVFFDLISNSCETIELKFNLNVSQVSCIKSKNDINSSTLLKLHIIIYSHLFIIFIFTTTK